MKIGLLSAINILLPLNFLRKKSSVLLLAGGLLPSAFCFSQPYWNEWINYQQKYYKIPIVKSGIYRISYTALNTAGFPLTSLDPKNLQVFFRGKEQYIYVKGESDGTFDAADYIEFYGKKNDGVLDSTLYKGDLYNNPAQQPNPYYSLFNDTSFYFLTWNTTGANRRIMDSLDTDFTIPQTNYFMREEVVENHTSYYYGKSTFSNINFPGYNEVEGWASTPIGYCGECASATYSKSFNTSGVFPQGNALLKVAVMGASDDLQPQDHHLQIKFRNSAGTYVLLEDIFIDGYRLLDSAFQVPASSLGSSTDISISLLPGNFSVSRSAIPYVGIRFPHGTDLENNSYYEFYVPENGSNSKSNFSFTNFSATAPVYIYDLTNNLRIPATKTGTTYKAIIPNAFSTEEKFCVITSDDKFIAVPFLKPVRGTGSFTDFSAQAVDSAFIIVTHPSLMTGASSYKNYRASAAGGSHNVLIADIEELYEQFAYGIPKHPFSIRHFAEFCADTFPSAPQNLFLLGKSVAEEKCRNQYNPSYWGNNLQNYTASLVPSIGYPTSDNMLVSALNGNLLTPVIPIGRLAAKTNTDISTYLNKVNEYEHPIPGPDEWMKHVIHLAGGKNSQDTAMFGQFLAMYENVIEDTSFGGYAHTFKKFSSSPTQTSYTDSIRKLINSGVSMITFFGHSSASVFDFNLLLPTQYDNFNGKYPFFLAAGCVAGDIHQPAVSGATSSEIYVLDKRGMIAFLASSGPGTAWDLHEYLLHFYKGTGQYLYGRSIGTCINAAIDSAEAGAMDPYRNATCLEMTLHGDPALVLHANPEPDYAVNNTSVYFSPTHVSAELDSFQTHVIVTNLGKAVKEKVPVDIRRTFSDGTFVEYSDTLQNLFYKDTLTFTLPVDPVHGTGLNKFEVRIPAVNAEITYLNNNITAPNEAFLMVYSGDILPVYPYKYAIVPDDTMTLKAYTANTFEPSARYIFEVDTTDLFNSPQKRTQYVKQAGAVVKARFDLWSSPLVLQDSVVYFWRVRRDTSDLLNFRWKESSFQYIPQKRGWGQSHFFQFLKGDKFRYVDTVRNLRLFEFDGESHSIEIKTINKAAATGPALFSMDGTQRYASAWTSPLTPAVIVSVINSATGELWYNDGSGSYGNIPNHPSKPGAEGFEFLTSTSAEQENLRRFLQDTIPCGSKVVLYTFGNHNLGDLLAGGVSGNPGLVKAFQDLGGAQFLNIRNNYPYILVGRKCGTGTEALGDSLNHTIFVLDSVTSRRESGEIFSEIIGPASKWGSLHWSYTTPGEPFIKDTIQVILTGVKSDYTSDTLAYIFMKDSLDILDLDQKIDASLYPYMKLEASMKDKKLRTPPQLSFWRVYYDGVPDAAINPVKHFAFHGPVIAQGDEIKMSVAIENIGDYDMDSLWVDFWVLDANRNKVPVKSIKLDSLEVDSLLIAEVKFVTDKIPAGLNSLWIEANPFGTQHQWEAYHFNNVATLPFNVNADKINPLLDVTFDGVHIMNGDIVSAKPAITIKLKDENAFLALNDTGAFDVFLKSPSKSVYDKIAFGSSMTFYPASMPDNSCRISYNPALPDGIYNMKVQAKDRTGNSSGYTEYKISFEVINKPTVTSVLNYPNPFSTSTRFVFTLTGAEVPDYFKIQILTVTGKIVRELDKHDLGPLHIGRNITEYAWDGKDEFGDQLANGLYLYRVVTQLDGKSLEHRETGADPFFTRGYGKMYLIR